MDYSNSELEIFSSIIQSGANKTVDDKNIITNYTGTVTAIQSDQKRATVRLAGSDSKTVTLINKVVDNLIVGNSVLIIAMDGKLSNGIITHKFGQSTAWSGTFKTADTTPRIVTVINGVIMTVV